MAADLSQEQVEVFTDVMVSKLATVGLIPRAAHHPPSKLIREEVQQVIVDTLTLCGADDPAALLDSWLDEI